MSDPSGEKRGSVSTSGVAVRRRACPPARPTTQRSPPYSNATASRLTAGWRSSLVPWACALAAHTSPRARAIDRRGIGDSGRGAVEKTASVYYAGIPLREQPGRMRTRGARGERPRLRDRLSSLLVRSVVRGRVEHVPDTTLAVLGDDRGQSRSGVVPVHLDGVLRRDRVALGDG